MKKIVIYTDGACSDNQNPKNRGGWGAIIRFPDRLVKRYGGEKDTTNNRMELTACIKALEELSESDRADLYSDSAYLVNCMHQKWYLRWQRNGWMNARKQPVENRDLWERILDLLATRIVTFHKVAGHAGVELNEAADRLANLGMEKGGDHRRNTGAPADEEGFGAARWQAVGDGFLVRLEIGAQVMENLTKFLTAQGIRSGIVAGLGALREVELGYFDLEQKAYRRQSFPGIYELLSFSGNISMVEESPFVHVHAVLGGPDFAVTGGHFFDGTVAVTCEIFIYPGADVISRSKDEATGLNLLDLSGRE